MAKLYSNVSKAVICKYISREVSRKLEKIDGNELQLIEEIRMRAGKPLMLCVNGNDTFVEEGGSLSSNSKNPVTVTRGDILKTLELISKNSLYAFMEELRNGFITLEGGHRVGVTGRTVFDKEGIKNIKDISGLNIRMAKEVKGCSRMLAKHIFSSSAVMNTLIVSPPQCGKTTILRDLARALSDGDYMAPGLKIGIVDERSEIAGCRKGIPQFDVGMRTDVLDACPKSEGMMMMIRSMSPEVLITDEIGRTGDFESIMGVLNAGVRIITSVHGLSVEQLKTRHEVLDLIKQKAFERYIVLSRRNGPGTLEEVVDGDTMRVVYRRVSDAS